MSDSGQLFARNNFLIQLLFLAVVQTFSTVKCVPNAIQKHDPTEKKPKMIHAGGLSVKVLALETYVGWT